VDPDPFAEFFAESRRTGSGPMVLWVKTKKKLKFIKIY
jgi:hypothetical protein